MPDGRPLDIIVETAGESTEETDVLELIDRIEARVREARGFTLEREVRLIGQWQGGER